MLGQDAGPTQYCDSSSWEFWIKPAVTSSWSELDGQVIFETGPDHRGAYLQFVSTNGTNYLKGYWHRDVAGGGPIATIETTVMLELNDAWLGDYVQIVYISDDDKKRNATAYMYLAVNGADGAGEVAVSDMAKVNQQWKFNMEGAFGDADGEIPNSVPAGTYDGFTGNIALIRIYDQALTDAEILEAYESVTSSVANGTLYFIR